MMMIVEATAEAVVASQEMKKDVSSLHPQEAVVVLRHAMMTMTMIVVDEVAGVVAAASQEMKKDVSSLLLVAVAVPLPATMRMMMTAGVEEAAGAVEINQEMKKDVSNLLLVVGDVHPVLTTTRTTIAEEAVGAEVLHVATTMTMSVDGSEILKVTQGQR